MLKKLNIDFDDFESEYEEKRHELVSDLQYNTLATLFSDLECGIADTIIESILNCVDEASDDSDKVFFDEVKYALRSFIIVDKYSAEDKECEEKVNAGELQACKFECNEMSNHSLYYMI